MKSYNRNSSTMPTITTNVINVNTDKRGEPRLCMLQLHKSGLGRSWSGSGNGSVVDLKPDGKMSDIQSCVMLEMRVVFLCYQFLGILSYGSQMFICSIWLFPQHLHLLVLLIYGHSTYSGIQFSDYLPQRDILGLFWLYRQAPWRHLDFNLIVLILEHRHIY